MSEFFALNFLLALVWSAISGKFTGLNLIVGFALGSFVLLIARKALGSEAYLTRLWRSFGFILFFLKELLLSSFRVAWEVVTPDNKIRPGVVGIELDEDTTDFQATLLANTITLTPGTLSVDIISDKEDPSKRILYIHAMYINDAERLRKDIKENFETRAKEVLVNA